MSQPELELRRWEHGQKESQNANAPREPRERFLVKRERATRIALSNTTIAVLQDRYQVS